MSYWQTARFRLDLDEPKVMGIVNVTPDSFSDGGRHNTSSSALAHCERLLADGADLLDIGGESTRPGASPVPLEVELGRVLPVLRGAVKLGVPISVDTTKPVVMQRALDLGCDIVNDTRALGQPGAFEVVAAHSSCGVCLMHSHGEPATMQRSPMEGDPVPAVRDFLAERSRRLVVAGVARERIVWDAGIGFGKTLEQNFALLTRQDELLIHGFSLMAAWSRKSSLGAITGLPPGERLPASLAAALLAVERGARLVRVHDVKETVAVLAVRRATIAGTSKRPAPKAAV